MAARKKKKTSSRKKTSRKKAPAPPQPKEMLVVGSKARQAIKDAGCNTGGDALEGLNEWVHWLLGQAVARAAANNRKTVRAHDFMAPPQ